MEFPDTIKQSASHARCIVEFCSYLTLHKLTESQNYLSDKDFRRLTFDMMIAWEDPAAESELTKVIHYVYVLTSSAINFLGSLLGLYPEEMCLFL